MFLNHKRCVRVVTNAMTLAVSIMLCNQVSAQDRFYRVHANEYEIIEKHLGGNYACEFMIISPEYGAAMTFPTSMGTTAQKAFEGLTFSEDKEYAYIDSSEDSPRLLFFGKDKIVGIPETPFAIQNNQMSGEQMTVSEAKGYYAQFDTDSPYFRIVYDDTNDTMIRVKTPAKDSNNRYYNMVYGKTPTGGGSLRFRISSENIDKSLSLYRRDYLCIEFADEIQPEIDGQITLKFGNAKVSTYRQYIYYILNDGSDVTLEELLASTNRVQVYDISSRDNPQSVVIPTDGESTTLWAVAAYVIGNSDDGDKITVSPIFSGKFAENQGGGGTTGISDIAAEENDVPIYYTLQGSRASMPLMPGVYIKCMGDKVSKVLIK